jgi:hypothetical protein
MDKIVDTSWLDGDHELWICNGDDDDGRVIVLVSYIDSYQMGDGFVVYSTNKYYSIGDHDECWPMWLFNKYDGDLLLTNMVD